MSLITCTVGSLIEDVIVYTEYSGSRSWRFQVRFVPPVAYEEMSVVDQLLEQL